MLMLSSPRTAVKRRCSSGLSAAAVAGRIARPRAIEARDAEGAEQQDQRGPDPQQHGADRRRADAAARNRRSGSGYRRSTCAFVSPACEALAHQHAQIMREIGVGIVDRLVAADETAQFLADVAGARFERRVGEHLVRPHGMGGGGCERSRSAEQSSRRDRRGDDTGRKAASCHSGEGRDPSAAAIERRTSGSRPSPGRRLEWRSRTAFIFRVLRSAAGFSGRDRPAVSGPTCL